MITLAASVLTVFDLVCVGTSQVVDLRSDPKPYEIRLRIDLDQKLYCEGACATTNPIFAVTQREIVLFSNDGPTHVRSESVSRETGKYTSMTAYRNLNVRGSLISAQCTPAPFSGFPSVKF